jgi:hypothetical protein
MANLCIFWAFEMAFAFAASMPVWMAFRKALHLAAYLTVVAFEP